MERLTPSRSASVRSGGSRVLPAARRPGFPRAGARRSGGRSGRCCRGRARARAPTSRSASRPFRGQPRQSPVRLRRKSRIGWHSAEIGGRSARPVARYHGRERSRPATRRTAMIDTSIEAALATERRRRRESRAAQPDPQETREWLDALDGVIDAEGAGRASELVRAIVERAATRGVRTPAAQTTPYVNTISVDAAGAVPGRSRHRGAAAPLHSLERDGDGRAREQGPQRARRPRRDVLVGGDAVRRRLQPLLARAVARERRRPRLFPRPLVARRLRARVPRRPHHRGASRELPPRSRRQRACRRIRIRG